MDIMNSIKKNGMNGLVEKYEHFAQEMQDALLENKKALAKLKKKPHVYIGALTACALLSGFALGKKK